MSEDNGAAERAAIEKEARIYGWVPKEDYKGEEASYLDAPEFVERGKQIMPIVQSNNRRLLGQVTTLTQELVKTQGSLKATEAAIAALEESRDKDVEAQAEAIRKQLKEELAAASREGDHEAVADLTDQMTRLNVADKGAKGHNGEDTVEGSQRKDGADDIHPALKAEITDWYKQNPAYLSDRRKMALAHAISVELREGGNMLTGSAFLDTVAEEVERSLGGKPAAGHSRVSGDNGGSGRRQLASGGQKTYADLPADAKAACDKQAARLVGENRAHKDMASWRASYVKQYFQE